LRVSEHRTGAGDDSAAEQCRSVEGHVVTDLDQCIAVHEHLLGKARQVEHLAERAALHRQPLRLAGRLLDIGVGAQREATPETLPAQPAKHGKGTHHAVAGLQVLDSLAHRLDRTRDLVTENARQGKLAHALHEVQIAVAQTDRSRPDKHLVATRPFDRDVTDDERRTELLDDGSFHEFPCSFVKATYASHCASVYE
jgi:hypothetical protein